MGDFSNRAFEVAKACISGRGKVASYGQVDGHRAARWRSARYVGATASIANPDPGAE